MSLDDARRPPGQRSGPAATAGAATELAPVSLQAVSDIAAQLLAEVARDSAMFRAAFAAGRAVGQAEGERAADERWSWAIAGAKLHADRPTHAEIRRRRAQVPDRPCGRPGCRACSVCVRAAAVARYGGDFPGVEQWRRRQAGAAA